VARLGSIFHFKIFSGHFIVLNTVDAVVELFEKRSKNYSGRPSTEMTRLVGCDVSIIFSQPGDRFNRYRKLLRLWLGPQQMGPIEPLQLEEVRRFLLHLGDDSCSQELTTHLIRKLGFPTPHVVHPPTFY
jgi:cytochrome P450